MSSELASQPVSSLQPPASPGSSGGALLQSYFRSGWAFLIPYLAAYLLYAWLHWPVNPGGAGEGIVKGISDNSTLVPSRWLLVPSLLHVYWALHATHIVLGAIALRSWWKRLALENGEWKMENGSPLASGLRSPVSAAAYRLLPWLCLALVFWIPGLYLEWPADPWEHLRRINEWHAHEVVTAHSVWNKASYFLPYSLTGHTAGLAQLRWLNCYYTAICALLSWQYYLLSRACGCGKPTAIVFTLLQALIFGNNTFSFHRYYALSSSINAQIGAVALVRIALEIGGDLLRSTEPSPRWSRMGVRFVPCSLLLLIFTGFNHVQGLALAGLGAGAVVAWRLIKWRRSMLWWLLGGTVIANALFLGIYPGAPFIESYREHGWLNGWYGFNLLDPESPAGNRMIHILGFFGLLNLALAVWRLFYNKVDAWLTLMPMIALLQPWLGIVIATALASVGDPANIVAFHRMLLAIPPGLAATMAVSDVLARDGRPWRLGRLSSIPRLTALALLGLILSAMLTSGPYGEGRTWHLLSRTPSDLTLLPYAPLISALATDPAAAEGVRFMTTLPGRSMFESTTGENQALHYRSFGIRGLALHPPSPELLIPTKPIPDEATLPSDQGDLMRLDMADRPNTAAQSDGNAFTQLSSPWILLQGAPPAYLNVPLFGSPGFGVQSAIGQSCMVLTQNLLPIESIRAYRITLSIRQTAGAPAPAYLFVAWYDREGRFLPSSSNQLAGAARPAGWENGTYSYFGLADRTPPRDWASYAIDFGWAQAAAIPRNAAFARPGALLNHNSTPDAVQQLAGLTVSEIPYPRLIMYAPPASALTSPSSQAGQLSTHWPPQTVASNESGLAELRATVLKFAHPKP